LNAFPSLKSLNDFYFLPVKPKILSQNNSVYKENREERREKREKRRENRI